jgi:hypothetical protein
VPKKEKHNHQRAYECQYAPSKPLRPYPLRKGETKKGKPSNAAILVLLLALVDHPAQLPLARKLLAQVGEVTEELLADGHEGVLGREGAVGLDADE